MKGGRLYGETEVRRLLDKVLAMSRADQTEAVFWSNDSALTRFANNVIHQNVAERQASITVRAVSGKRVAVASANDLSIRGLRKVVERAELIARYQVENPDFVSLPGPAPVLSAKALLPSTLAFGPERRARMAGVVCRLAREKGLVASGALQVSISELAVANSLGVFAYHPQAVADINTVVMADSGSGYADTFTLDASELDAEAIARVAVDKAVRSQDPVDLAPGEYPVFLEEHAVNDILDFLGYLGFSALAVQEGRSFMGGRFGQQIMDPKVSIWDDGLGPDMVPMPFDFEGVPKRRVDFVSRGTAAGVCYDSYTAHKEGKQSTGHALPPPNTYGPVPMNQFLGPGTATVNEMLRGIDRGIWVTRFHYTRHLHPLTVAVTGMTRDGTFLIEKGEITRPIKNLRFTQSYVDALKEVDMISRETRLQGSYFSYNRVPALRLPRWNFVSATEY
ncbi:MAG TPA: TldD/PmbA family protein [Dehalococcoidia bacterium]|nr:TldD/PmbA family protein [Dehalococcoidia bacterium]